MGVRGDLSGYPEIWDLERENFYEEKAVAILREQIRDWDREGYRFAANLLRHFVNKRGPSEYVPKPSDITEVKRHGLAKIKDVVWNSLPRQYREDLTRGGYSVKFIHPGMGSGKKSNIRWYPTDNLRMFYAYFGADMNLDGKVWVTHHYKLRWFWKYKDRTEWAGRISVRLGDEWVFDKGMLKNLPRMIFKTYAAGLWLERRCGYSTFYHEMKFTAQWKRERR
jgi:hypothetical protein